MKARVYDNALKYANLITNIRIVNDEIPSVYVRILLRTRHFDFVIFSKPLLLSFTRHSFLYIMPSTVLIY